MSDQVHRLGLLIKAVHRQETRELNAALSDFGITAPQAEALAVLAERGPLSLQDLGRLLIAEGGHPSRLVDRLVMAGWVARTPAAEDRRRVVLALTAEGRELHETAQARAAPQYAALADRLVGHDLAAACEALTAALGDSDLAEIVDRRLAARHPGE